MSCPISCALAWTTVPAPDDMTRTASARPALVILHGLFGAGRNWSLIARRLAADGWRVVLPDLRNHGESPWAASMRYSEQAGDLAALLDVVAPDAPAIVIGHSMGGKVAMRLALEHPARLAALCVVDVAPVDYGGARGLEAYAQAMLDLPLEGLTRRAEADQRLAEAVPEAGIRAFLLQNLMLPGPAQAARGVRPRWRLNLPVIAASLPDLAGWPAPPDGAVHAGPTLVLAGAESGYVTPAREGAIANLFPAAQVQRVPGAGHWVHAEAPDATVASLSAFLDRVAGASA